MKKSITTDLNLSSYNTVESTDVYNNELEKQMERYVYQKYFARPGRLLDIGCGTGRTSVKLHELGHDMDAIDYSEAMIKTAKSRHSHINFKVMDATRMDYPGAEFDYCYFSFNGIDCIYPESKRLEALREIYRVLKPGGIFAFSSHNSTFIPNGLRRIYRFLRSAFKGKIHPYRYENHPYGEVILYYISPEKQRKQLEDIGFEFIEVASKYPEPVKYRDPWPHYICRKPAAPGVTRSVD